MRSDPLSGRTGRPYSTLLLGALTFSLAAGCSIKSPSAPSWEVEYNLPLLNQWYDITDFLDDEDFGFFGSDSIYAVDFDESLERFEIGSDITLDDISQSISQSIGTFSVPAAQPESTSVSLVRLGGPATTEGKTLPIPALSFTGIETDLPPFDAFTQVVIETGSVSVQVTNRTEVDFDTLNVRLLDEGAGDTLIVAFDITQTGTLNNGETRVVNENLDGLTIVNDLSIEVRGHSLAGDALLDGDEEVAIVVAVGELRVSSATAEVGEIDFDFDPPPSITITDSTKVESALLSAGFLTLTLDNQLPVPFYISIELSNITDGAGSPVLLNLQALPFAQGSDSQDLAGYTIEPVDDGSGGKEFVLVVNVHSDGSGGNQATLSNTSEVSVQADITGMVIQSVTGVLDATTIDIPEESFELVSESGNVLDEVRKIDFTEVDLELAVRHNIDFPATLQLSLAGEGGIPDPVQLNLLFNLAASGYTPVDSTDTFFIEEVYTLEDLGETEENLLQFLNALPTGIRYSGSATVGDGTYLGSVSSYSSFEADIHFSTPLEFDITEPISIELDKEYEERGLEIEAENVEIQETTLTYSISSTMGLPLNVSLTVAADSALVYSDPDVELLLAIRGSGEAARDTVITLTREQWELLEQPFYTGVRIVIAPDTGSTFRLTRSERIYTKAFATLKAIVNPIDGGEGGGR